MLWTIIIGAVLVLIVSLIISRMVRDKKEGKSGCGCGCDSCPSSSICHSAEDE